MRFVVVVMSITVVMSVVVLVEGDGLFSIVFRNMVSKEVGSGTVNVDKPCDWPGEADHSIV